MIEHIITVSIRRRWPVLLLTFAAALSGVWSLTRLPIDAVPDITNVQVQVNAFAPALSPLEIEKQVTFPIEIALSGIPVSKAPARSLPQWIRSSYGRLHRQDGYLFARQQVSERLTDAKSNLPTGRRRYNGPDLNRFGRGLLVVRRYVPLAVGTQARDGKTRVAERRRLYSHLKVTGSLIPYSVLSTCARYRTGSYARR